jgi:hypothetical protein
MAVIAASLLLFLCGVPPTLVLWLAVVEEVFSRLIAGHKKAGSPKGPGMRYEG